jgi:hypothetical protein
LEIIAQKIAASFERRLRIAIRFRGAHRFTAGRIMQDHQTDAIRPPDLFSLPQVCAERNAPTALGNFCRAGY